MNPIFDTLWMLACKLWWFPVVVLVIRFVISVVDRKSKLDGR